MIPPLFKATRSLIALAAGLCLAAMAQVAAGAEPAALRFAEGRVFGVIAEQPLAETLDLFAAATGLDYRVPEDLLGHPVSGRFEGAPAAEALERLLRPFDYIAVSGADGAIATLRIRGLRGAGQGSEGTAATTTAPAGGAVEERQPYIYSLSDEELLEEAEYLDLEALAAEAGVPLEALYDGVSARTGKPELNINFLRSLLERRERQ